ncbi:MAG: hypothetical protein RLZZ54_2743 [Cyanobacteriota bacterium]|jgi:hypothetical protein
MAPQRLNKGFGIKGVKTPQSDRTQRDQHMSGSSPRPTAHQGDAESTCSCCGGSGVLRIDSSAYRTCLECLGQGQKPRFETVFGLPDPLAPPLSQPLAPPLAEPARRLRKGFRGDLSAWTSGAR